LKHFMTLSLILAFTTSFSFAHATQPVTKEVNIAVNDVFVPESVEANADTKIVLSGMFPNSCYRWSRAEVASPADNFHQVKAMALVTVNTMCLMVLVPYSKEVNLGKLSPGEHTLRFVSGDDTFFERTVVVK